MTDSLGGNHFYEMKLKEKRVGFVSIGRFCHPKVRDIMSISRVVIVPEFQGFNLGMRFIEEIASIYKSDRVRITTSLKPFMIALSKSKSWICVRNGRVSSGSGSGSIHNKKNKKSFSCNRITATFEYIR